MDGSYKIQRPFIFVTKQGTALSAAAQAFFDFATSADANEIIAGAGARAGRGISAVFRKRSRKLPGDACRPRGSCRVRRFL